MNIVITGNPGCGKTTVCEKVIRRLEEGGIRCGGILCPEVKENGRRVGTNAVDVMTREERIMAMLKNKAEFDGIEVGRYSLNRKGIEFGKDAIENAMNCNVIVIDEIGPVELSNDGMIDAAVKALDSENSVIVIVRSKLKKKFLEGFKDREFIVFDVSEENRKSLPEEISRRIENGN